MNKTNPLVPQGTFADKGRSHVRLTVFAILAVHLVMLCVLLIAGCNKGTNDPAADPNAVPPPPPPPPVVTDLPPPPPPVTNPPGATLGGTPPPPQGGPPSTTFVEPPPPPPPPPAQTEVTEHTIVQGESFYTLSKKYNLGNAGYKAIAEANPGVDSTKLKIGQKIKIPARPSAAAPTAGTPVDGAVAHAAGGEITHVVKSGDNLWTLSRKYGVKESAIRSANNLKTAQLKVGQKLKIPAKSAPAPETPPVDHGGAPPPPAGGLLLPPP